MKIFEFIANCRSGHHSIYNWIIRNKIGFQYGWEYKFAALGDAGLFHLSEANHDIHLSFKFIEESLPNIDTLFVGYEDTFWDYTIFSDDNTFRGPQSLKDYKKYSMDYQGRIIFIRNFYSNLASRVKSNENKLFGKWDDTGLHIFDTGEKYIERWKSQARACVENKVIFLKFEDWVKNKKVREDFLLNNFGLKDIYGIDGIEGTRSSFEKRDKVLSRIEEIELPEETKNLIRNDSELHYLIGKMGYDYIKI